jgi:ammonium transporter, Amt family
VTQDLSFVLVSTGLVVAMVFGVAMFYAAFDHQAQDRAFKAALLSACAVSVQWYLLGYGLAFGGSFLGLVGLDGVPADWSSPSPASHLPHSAFASFQAAFAAVTVALLYRSARAPLWVPGLLIWTTLVYDPVAHWVWGDGGWLRALGAIDFAGGTVVHVVAGASVLGMSLAGPRAGRTPGAVDPTMLLLGTAVLFVGWFGFNAGSALRADGLAAGAVMATYLAACSGSLFYLHQDGLTRLCLGMISGLVAITPASGTAGPVEAVVIGAVAALCCSLAQRWLEERLDDPMDVVAVHGVGGVVGSVATGVLEASPVQVGIQILAVVAVAAYAACLTAAMAWAGLLTGRSQGQATQEQMRGLRLVPNERGQIP